MTRRTAGLHGAKTRGARAPARAATGAAPRATRGTLERDELRQRILATVDSIPRGRVATYGQVAREAGLPRHARLVGRVLGELPSSARLPWHRVVNAAGKISLRGDGDACAEQLRRLAREGVVSRANGTLDLAACGWDPGVDAAPRPRRPSARPRRAL